MLRPEQISNAKFTPVSAGTYSSEEVDAFLSIVAEAYEESLNERTELIKKISILAEKVDSYRKDEEAIKNALLDAHKMAESVSKTANDKAEAVIAEAEEKAKTVKDDADKYSAELSSAARMQAGEIVNNARTAVNSLTARAQDEADELVAKANTQADGIIAEANKKGAEIIGNSKKEFEYYSAELTKVKSEMVRFKALVEDLCNGNIHAEATAAFEEVAAEAVEEVPAAEVEEPAAEEAAEEPAAAEEVVAEEPAAEEKEVPEEIFASEAEPEVPSFGLSEIDMKFEELVSEAKQEAEAAPAAEVPAEVQETAEDVSADSDLDDFFGLFDDEEEKPVEAPAEDIDDLFPADFDDEVIEEPVADVPAAPEVPSAEKEELDDDFSDLLAASDEEGEAEDEDDDITSLFDSLF